MFTSAVLPPDLVVIRDLKIRGMDKKRYVDLHEELLRKKFYDNVMNCIFTSKTQPSSLDPGILNGYIAEFVAISNTNSSRFHKSHSSFPISHKKSHKPQKELGYYNFQNALQDIPEEQSEFSDMLENCPDHSQEVLKYFCETCDEPICLDCTMADHRKHRFCYLSDVYHKQTHNLGTLLSQGKTEIETTRKSLNEVKTLLSTLNDGKKAMENAIHENTKRLTQALFDREKELLQAVDSAYQNKETFLSKEKEHLELILERLNGSCHCTEKAIKIGNELEMLVIQKHLKRKLNEVKNTRRDFSSTEFRSVHYSEREDAVSLVRESMGDIIVSDTCAELSMAEGEGLRRAKLGAPADIVVTAMDFNEKRRLHGGDTVTVNVKSPSRQLQPPVEDKGDGTYCASFTPSESGDHEVAIEIHKKPIKHSPFLVHVASPRDYASIARPFLVFGSYGEGKGKFKLPCGVTVDRSGRIIVTDCHNHRVQIFDQEGRYLRSFGSLGEKNGQLNNPTDVCVDKNDNIFVCDKDNHRIQSFTKEGLFLSKFGRYGDEPGCLKRPWGITISSNGHVVVTDRINSRVQVFKEDGSLIKVVGSHGSGDGHLDNPYHAVVSADGTVYVTDGNNHRVQVFDSNGNNIKNFGNDAALENAKLKYPTGIALDNEGHVLVGDQYNHRIQVFDLEGELVTSITAGLQGPGQSCYPKGLAVTPEGRIVLVDSDNHRVVIL
ncbi:E3 ubiquitin-protein ligase TRIM71-like [Nematostella vectensis]|uniref:E3 ubiquitin-protein ligase TRIM71-like n=1 Tax=Nematostella vectensis TaxID=45351 RepID=UPI0020770DFC|nr:E3 ubiquitin-protein ligase TRIM71-like [Nematostella vectensis]XP_048579294.1 E3 ubiquitin-protein ligase TRIM71-like [Nematostella vectensis]XP_048579295.1 E3 ubiquitin-protein ligase TRIM71-like [Nematostella vectensis]